MIIFDERITLLFYSTESLYIDPVKIQVTCCRYKQVYVRVAMYGTVRIPAHFFWGGGAKFLKFSLFGNKKALFKGI